MFTLADIAGWLKLTQSIGDDINDLLTLETDARLVDRHSVFVALPGVSSQGWDYLDQAL